MSIQVSESAAARIRQVVAERQSLSGLRFGLRDGGCSGYSYLLDFESEADDDDVVIEQHGAKVFVHPMHMPFLSGSVIDYTEAQFQSGFQVQNPNVKRACGCGESFDV